ncbi:putative secreted protein [Corynebacterium diphtheriae CDCE 8392]|nr:putative secreted protein [Corynebacterium diphtheriae CDCE 8392]
MSPSSSQASATRRLTTGAVTLAVATAPAFAAPVTL